MTRFEHQFPELASKLRDASAAKLRTACVTACEYAVTQAKMEEPIVTEALTKMRAGEDLAASDRRKLEALVERLDREYVDLAKAFDQGRASIADFQKPFAKARAVASVLFAFEGDPLRAASEAIYEAFAVSDQEEPGVLLPAIEAVLR